MKKIVVLLIAMFLCVACMPNTTNADLNLKIKAYIGNAEAQYNLGWCYDYGKGV